MYVYNLFTFLCCVMFAGSTEVMTSNVSGKCEHGTYQHKGITCCLCPKGYRLESECSITDDTKCERCKPGSYTDHPNNDRNCQPCKICDSNVNMEEKESCSLYSNTICKCQKNYYCDKGEQCRSCTPCDNCDTEVETECTETNNTVCKDANSKGVIRAAVLVPILILIIGVVLIWLWKRKKTRKHTEMQEVLVPLKTNVDLNSYLPEIADQLGWKLMKRIAQRSGMTKASIENHECNHPNDAKERTIGLLQEWYQAQGLYQAYPALIKALHAINERTVADKIQEIVEK